MQELCRLTCVCQNPTDFSCRQEHELGSVFEEELVYGILITKIQLGEPAQQHIVASQRFQSTNDCGAHKSAMPGHKHPGGFCESHMLSHGLYPED